MKIQCSCGTKVAFDVTPEMARTRVQFVCPNCGQDSSDLVNELIRQEFANEPSATPPPAEIAPPLPEGEASSPPRPRPVTVSVRPTSPPPTAKPTPPVVTTRQGSDAQPGIRVGDAARAASSSKFCAKHPGQRTTNQCVVCHKPICPKCMQLFGYVCSPHCKERAELQGIEVPVYAGRKDIVARGQWRRTGLIATGITVTVAAALGVWIWYAWFATVPGPVFSIRFDQAAYSGKCKLVPENQLVFLHGLTLARCDLKTKKEIWSVDIMSREDITNVANIALQQLEARHTKEVGETGDADWRVPSQQEMVSTVARGEAGRLDLKVMGKNVWVTSFKKLTRYDFDTGKAAQVIGLDDGDRVQPRGDEILIVSENDMGRETVEHVDLNTGQTQDEVLPIAGDSSPTASAGLGDARPRSAADFNPDELAARYSNMSTPEKVALPAVLSVERNQQAALKEMRDDDRGNPTPAAETPAAGNNVARPLDSSFRLILTKQGVIQMSTRLLEANITVHQVMKDAPTKSALDGNMTVSKSADVAGEILNDMRRDQGGATETVDESRYQVIIRRGNTNDVPDWSGEVIGPPHLYSLQTVDVVAGGSSITVLNKNNKQLWQSQLAFTIGGGLSQDELGNAEGQGPCVERGDTLYVCDQGVLSAFDLATGNARWRVPTVGIYDLNFNDDGMLYVSTTSASPEKIKYSHQIDLTDKTTDVLIKIDPKDGKILWNVQPGGQVAYVSGKFIYTLSAYQPFEDDEHPFENQTGFETPPYMRLRRINPADGKEMWEYFQQRAPLDAQFDKNLIELVFKKEVVVLKYFTL